MAETIKIEIPISVEDKTNPALSNILELLEKLDTASKNAAKSMKDIGSGQGIDKSMQKAGKSAQEMGKSVQGVKTLLQETGTAAQSAEKSVQKTGEKLEALGGKTHSISLEVKDTASPALTEIAGGLNGTSEGAEKSVSRLSKLEKAAQKVMGPMKSAASWAGKRYQSIMEIKDMASPAISKITSGLKSVEKKAWTTTFKVASAPIKAAASAITSPLVTAGIPLSAGAMMGSSVHAFSGFESQMSQVKAISGATAAEFDQLTAKAKEMGATTKFTAQEAGEAMNYMAMAGWKPQQMLDGISGIMSLAAASGEDLGTTSDIVTDALTAFGLKASDAGHFSDVLAQASSNANTDVGMLGESFKYVAPVAGALRYRIEDTSLALGLMANASIKGGIAGTSLRTSLANMASPTKAMAEAMDKYGISLTDSEGNMKSLRGVMENLRGSLGNLSETEQTAAASAIFGKEAMAGMLAIVNASEDDWKKLAKAVDHADGASQRMADTMLDNLSGKFTLFQSALDGVKISLGERVSPYLVEALGWITDKMPAVERALMRGMDGIDSFIDKSKEKIGNFTSTPEWEDSGLLGKMSIAWDELVGDPLTDWWSGVESTIKGKAVQIGETIGEGLSGGLLALLGFDVGEGVNEGVSIGASFLKGFIRGFDGNKVFQAVAGSIGGQFLNAGKLFTGDGDASSWASAAAIVRTGVPLLKGAGKVVSGVKKAFGTETVTDGSGGTTVVPGIGRKILGSAAQGTGLAGFSAKTAIKLGADASLSSGALSAIGLSSVAGGIVGGIGLGSSIINIVKAVKSKDSEEQSTHLAAGILEGTSVGVGAAAGAAIGAAFGGVGAIPGALIGAGIAGFGGMIGGHHINKNYEERKATEATMAEKSKYALEGARFEMEGLSDAFKDASVSADEFGVMMQEATAQKIQDGFGNIKLSVQDIKDAASQILFEGDDKGLSRYAEAASDAGMSMNNLRSVENSMGRLNWKANMGMLNSAEGMAQYQTGIQDVISGAQEYVEDQHYQATAAIDLLVEPGTPVDMLSGLNGMYTGIQEQLSSIGGQLQMKTSIALEDGIITLDEQSELSNLQQQISDITGQISDAQSEAGMQSLKIKYSGTQLDYDSFAGLTSELQSQMQESISSYDDALELSLTNLNMQLKSGAINKGQFNSQFQALTEGYQAHIQDLSVSAESFQLETIADSFGKELDGILPEIKGTTAEKLGTAMHDAMSEGVDVENWDIGTASKWLGLEGLSAETQSAVASMMSLVATTMPDSLVEALNQSEGADTGSFLSNMIDSIEPTDIGTSVIDKINEGLSSADMSESGGGVQEGIQNALTASMENIDLSETATSLNSKLGEAMSSVDMSEGGEGAGSGLAEGLQNTLAASLEEIDLSETAASLNGKLGEAMSGLEMEESGGGLAEGISNSITASLEGVDLSGAAESISASLNESLSGAEAMNLSGFGESLSASLNAAVSGIDYSGVTSTVGTGISSAIEASMGTIQGAISNLYSQVGAAINGAFAAGFQTTTTVTITVNYQLANPTATISFSGGGTGTATVSASIASNAEGSIVNGRILSWVGEDGPEAIIPLGSKRRQRGIELWQQAGRMMGIHEYAEGGIVGAGVSKGYLSEPHNLKGVFDQPEGIAELESMPVMPQAALDAEKLSPGQGLDFSEAAVAPVPVNTGQAETGSTAPNIIIHVDLSPTFEVQEGSGESTETIKGHLRDLADELAGELAEKLSEIFENTPII